MDWSTNVLVKSDPIGPAERGSSVATWLLAAAIDTGDTALEETLVGLEVTAIGMAVVFAVLVLLYFIMIALGRFVGERTADLAQLAPVVMLEADGDVDGEATALPMETCVVAAATETELQEPGTELAAAISAALAAAMVSEIRPAAPAVAMAHHSRLGWALAGRTDQITARERLPRG